MTKNSAHKKEARAYMEANPGVRFTEAMRLTKYPPKPPPDDDSQSEQPESEAQ